MENLILSLFPGIGLLDRAFEAEGFCVVRGPDLLWGGDIRAFHPPAGIWGGIIGGPPCQAFSRLRHLVEHNGYQVAENLIPEFERCVYEGQPDWFLMENVPAAPTPSVPGYQVHYQVLNNRWFGGEQNRVRAFSFGTRDGRKLLVDDLVIFEATSYEPAVLASGGGRPVPVAIGGNGKRKRTLARNRGYASSEYFARACRLQGLPEDFDLPGFTLAAKVRAVGNGVPWWLAQAVAKGVKRAVGE